MALMSSRLRRRRAAVALLVIATAIPVLLLLTRMNSLPSEKTPRTLQQTDYNLEKESERAATVHMMLDHPTNMEVFRQRKSRLQQACAISPPASSLMPPFQYGVMTAGRMAYCPMPKSGSTVWKRILYYIDQRLNVSFLDVVYGDIHAKTMYMFDTTYRHPMSDGDVKSVVFVREPYSRLFAGYLDKLFTPRRANWIRYAQPVQRYTRKYATAHELACAHDVEFAEFVEYYVALETGDLREPRDEHFVPLTQLCGFCHRDYDFVGHQETFASDTLGILEQLNASGLLTPADFAHEYARYEMEALVRYTFANELEDVAMVGACMSREEALRRLWKVLQVRGCLSAREFFPFTEEDCQEVTADVFMKLATEAFQRSLNDPHRKSNYRAAMMEAYSTVSFYLRNALRGVLWKDFMFFGYDASNPIVFPPEDNFLLPDYRYFDIFDTFLFDTVDEFNVKV